MKSLWPFKRKDTNSEFFTDYSFNKQWIFIGLIVVVLLASYIYNRTRPQPEKAVGTPVVVEGVDVEVNGTIYRCIPTN